MAKKSKKPAKRARKKPAKALKARKAPKSRKAPKARKAPRTPKMPKTKVPDLASGGASDDVTGHLMSLRRR